jgi:hypothetical protein
MNQFKTIKNTARRYFDANLNVIPLQGKQPLINWIKWQKEKQTQIDFESMPWEIADGFALIGGSKNGDSYFGVIDVDVKNVSKEAVEKGKQVVSFFPQTKIEGTPSGGQHLIYWSRIKPKTLSFLKICGLEILGEKKLIIMAPSEGYSKLNNADPIKINDLQATFYEALHKANINFEDEHQSLYEFNQTNAPFKGEDPPCIQKMLKMGVAEGNRNNFAIRLSSYLLNFRKLIQADAWKRITNWNNKNTPPLSSTELSSILESTLNNNYCYGCKDSILKKYCNQKKCSLKQNIQNSNSVIHLPFIELPDGKLAEQAFDGKTTFFLVFDPTNEKILKLDEIHCGDTIFKPILNDEVRCKLTLFPSDVEEYQDDVNLLTEMVAFMDRWHEAPTSRDRKLDTLYILLTYINDLLPRTPYRRMVGALGRGKSAWIETIGAICYRSIKLAGCDTDKAICRRLNMWRGTALIDEADFGKSNLYAFITKILNMGYDAKTGFYQRCDDKDPTKVITYRVYGPKILASRSPFKDMALESRCIKTIARENRKSMPLFRMAKFASEAQQLRNKLILWRFRHYSEIKERVNLLESIDFEEKIGIGNVSSRIKEILAPLALVSDEFKTIIPVLAHELDEELKTDRSYQLELEFNDAVIQIVEEGERQSDDSDGSDATTGYPSIKNGIEAFIVGEEFESQKAQDKLYQIPLTKIAKKILRTENPETKQLSGLCRSLSNMVKTRLGLKVVQGTGGRRYVELLGAYIRSITTSTTLTKPKCKVVKL